MLNTDRDAVLCDLAETYNIYDYRSLPAVSVAMFASGLRDGSRIKLKLVGESQPLNTMLLAAIADRLALLLWARTKDGEKGRNRPKMIVESLTEQQCPERVKGFKKAEDFERTWATVTGGERNG